MKRHVLTTVTCCRLDLATLSSELVEIILWVIPNDHEIQLYREYEADGKPVEVLADEDKFMLSVSCGCSFVISLFYWVVFLYVLAYVFSLWFIVCTFSVLL